MRVALTLAAVLGLALLAPGVPVVLAGCCPDSECPEAAFASFHLTCSPNDLTKVESSGPCSTPPDAGVSFYTGAGSQMDVGVGSMRPGNCHIVLTFATGFTYSADVTFTTQTSCGGCSYQAPTSGPFTVNNPPDTCVPLPDSGGEE
jgi:hypothetical protein